MALALLLSLLQEAMKHLSGLLPEGLKKEIFGLWEVRVCVCVT